MPCLVILLIGGFPRLVLVLMWLFSNYLDRAYHGLVIPLLGFFFMPLTTICYAWLTNNGMPVQGFNFSLVVLIIAALIDLGSHGGSTRYVRRRR